MNLKNIFSVFSHRHLDADLLNLPSLPESFRTRVLLLIRNRFSNSQYGNILSAFWQEMHEKLAMSIGSGTLIKELNPSNPLEDVTVFLMNCQDKYFIDFLELIFKSDYHGGIIINNDNEFVNDINELFLADDLPYYVTNFRFSVKYDWFYGKKTKVRSNSLYPKVILKENELIHKSAIKPSLTILENDDFKLANTEFMDALTDFRDGDYGDCLTKCGSSFESVMKVICSKNGWSYKQNDTASRLLNIILDNSNLPRFYESPLIIIATMRNKISKSHGAGTQPKNPTKNIAQYSINQTASSIIFLVNELYPNS